MATARSCHQPSISQFLLPLQRSSFSSVKDRVPISPTGAAARGARCSAGGDFSPEQKRTAAKKAPRGPRRLITISTADGRWQGEWYCNYVFSLRELGIADVADLGQADSKALISLVVQKHAGFGFSVEGKTATSFNRRCSSCFRSFVKEIDASFDVWVLTSSRSDPLELPEIGSGDSSVIYVMPGTEADLDSLIRDTIRLAVTANQGACSEACEKSSTRWNCTRADLLRNGGIVAGEGGAEEERRALTDHWEDTDDLRSAFVASPNRRRVPPLKQRRNSNSSFNQKLPKTKET